LDFSHPTSPRFRGRKATLINLTLPYYRVMGMSEVGEKVAKIFYWKCPRCGKTIESLYEPQLKANIEAHKRKCGGG
jgi:hypothetical protein